MLEFNYYINSKKKKKKIKKRQKSNFHTNKLCFPHITKITSPPKKKCKIAKWLSQESLQIAVKKRETKSKGGKERYTHLNAEFQRIERRDEKAFLRNKGNENKKWERLEISSTKLEIPR